MTCENCDDEEPTFPLEGMAFILYGQSSVPVTVRLMGDSQEIMPPFDGTTWIIDLFNFERDYRKAKSVYVNNQRILLTKKILNQGSLRVDVKMAKDRLNKK